MTNPRIKIWLMAIRPKTLTASVSPVIMGTAMAFGDGIEHWPTAVLCLLGALSIQILTNLANDYFDYKHGADTQERIGPTRVIQAGLVSAQSMKIAVVLTLTIIAGISYVLTQRGGTPILIIGVLSILAGVGYTAGPKPLGYVGLGDVLVLIFFGPIAVAGTYYVQSLEMNMAVFVAGLAPGLLSTAVLCVNNLRDIETDRKAGKKTWAVRFGKGFAQSEYLFCILAASSIPALLFLLINDHRFILIACVVSLLAVPGFKTVLTKSDGPSLNEALAFTGKLVLIFSILFSVGWLL